MCDVHGLGGWDDDGTEVGLRRECREEVWIDEILPPDDDNQSRGPDGHSAHGRPETRCHHWSLIGHSLATRWPLIDHSLITHWSLIGHSLVTHCFHAKASDAVASKHQS